MGEQVGQLDGWVINQKHITNYEGSEAQGQPLVWCQGRAHSPTAALKIYGDRQRLCDENSKVKSER